MAVYQTRGIIIKKMDYAEADRILTVFTSGAGKVRAIAKGVRRTTSKMGGHLELFNVVDLMLAEGKNLQTITSVRTIDRFANICESLYKTCKAYYLIEILDKLTPDEYKDTRVFDLYVETFKLLNKQVVRDDLQENLLIQASKLKMLKLLGFAPEVDRCLNCNASAKADADYYFSNAFGGVICQGCRRFDKTASILNSGQFKLLRVLSGREFSLILKLKVDLKNVVYLNEILNSYLRYIIEKDIKSLQFMRKVDNLK